MVGVSKVTNLKLYAENKGLQIFEGISMTVYCVSYDLNKSGQNYKALYDELESSSGYWHYLDSTWLVSTSETADQLSNRILKHLDSNDSLLVIKVVSPKAGWLPQDAWDWINQHITV